jgi:hypothetical protein
VLALIYIDRLIQRNNFLLTELNVHRVVITSVLLAAKFFDDAYYNNAYYAKVGGVLTSEMNGLEVDFLFRINFSLHVTSDVFEKYRVELAAQAGTVSFQAALTLDAVTPAVLVSQVQQPSPVMQAAPPGPPFGSFQALDYRDYTPTYVPAQQASQYPSRITPSPPNAAAKMLNDVLLVASNQPNHISGMEHQIPLNYYVPTHYPCMDPMNSGSDASKGSYTVQPMLGRCGESAIGLSTITAPNLMYPEEPILVVDHRLYAPATPGLVHHQHGGFASHMSTESDYGVCEAQHLLSNRVLAGLGGGM